VTSTALAAADVTVVAEPERVATGTKEAQDCTTAHERQTISVFVAPPRGSSISTAVVDLTYDANRVALPGARNEKSVRGRLRGFPMEATSAVNDKTGAVRVAVTGTRSLPRTVPLFTVEFDVCAGATPPASGDYACEVANCVAMTVPIEGCTCRVETTTKTPTSSPSALK
jgi:hypothetical protein